MSRDHIEKPQNQENPRDIESSSAEEGAVSKKSRSLLRVPSRSSFKNQPSPTASGLSGITTSESRESFGDRSKDSKASIMGRHRNGSASSNRSGGETAQTANSGAQNVAPQQKKKKGGLFAMLCCGVPDDANMLDNEPANVPGHKVEKLPPRPTTASRRQTPSEHNNSRTQLQEKEIPQAQSVADSSKAKRVSGTTSQDQSTLAEESKPSTLVGPGGPTVTVDPPLQETPAPGPVAREVPRKDEEGDVEMADAAAVQDATEPPAQPIEVEEVQTFPPAPPMPVVPSPPQDAEGALVTAPDQPQQEWLLPPIQPHLKGRKCLVLDLDETLVHSSFKVCS